MLLNSYFHNKSQPAIQTAFTTSLSLSDMHAYLVQVTSSIAGRSSDGI